MRDRIPGGCESSPASSEVDAAPRASLSGAAMSELPKTFEPGCRSRQRWYDALGDQRAVPAGAAGREPWTIVMPPPNVTGSLHIGHALDNTLQDILTRHARMQGKDALWVVGTDHAGIATQMVVERNLESQGIKRAEIGREAFLEHVWEWKAQSGGAITRQLRRLGAICDWANERFTMDEGFRRAVIKVFVELYKRGLLYRDKRLVNWDPKFQTAISDLEVENARGAGQILAPAISARRRTSRAQISGARPRARRRCSPTWRSRCIPTTSATGRWSASRSSMPITGPALIPIVADEHADPELGSGAVKITPGHDFNDFEVGKRAGFKPARNAQHVSMRAQARVVPDRGRR